MELILLLILLMHNLDATKAESILLEFTSAQNANTTSPSNKEPGNGTSTGQRGDETNQDIFTPGLTIGIAVGGAVLLICIIVGIILLIRCRHRSRQRTSPLDIEIVPVDPKEKGIRPRNSKLPHQYVNVNIQEDSPDAIEESSNGNSPSSVSSHPIDESPLEVESVNENVRDTQNDTIEYDSFDDDDEEVDDNEEEFDDDENASDEFTDSEEEETATDDDIYKNEVLIKLVNSVSNRKSKEILNSEQGTPKGSTEKIDSYETVELKQPTSDDVIREISQSLVKRDSKTKRSSKKENRYTHDGSYHLESYENVELSDSRNSVDLIGNDENPGESNGESNTRNTGNCLKPNEYIKSKKRSGVKPNVPLKPPKRHTIHDTACYDDKREEIAAPKKSSKPAVKPKKANKSKPVAKPAVKLPDKGTAQDKIAFFNTTKLVVPSKGYVDTGSDDSTGRDKSNISVKYAAVNKDRKQKAQSHGGW